jgi:hypothetical protein
VAVVVEAQTQHLLVVMAVLAAFMVAAVAAVAAQQTE